MKIPALNLVVNVILIASVVSLSPNDLKEKVLDVDHLFAQHGPTMNVLQAYEDVIRTAKSSSPENSLLSQLYFKKAIIEISLNKNVQAVSDLRVVMDLDPAMKPAKEKLIQLLTERGDFETLSGYINKKDDAGIYALIDTYNQNIAVAQKLLDQKEYQQCIDTLNTIMGQSPTNYEINDLYYKAALGIYQNNPGSELNYFGESLPTNKVIVLVLKNLVEINPMANLDCYSVLSQFLLYTEVQFDGAVKVIKNCLRIDNEFKSCGKLSKYYSKFQDFFKVLEDYSIIQGHYYMNVDDNAQLQDEDLVDPKIDYLYVVKFMFSDDLQVSKIDKRQLPSSVKTNYQYIEYQAKQFLQTIGLSDSTKTLLMSDLNKLVCESYIMTNNYKAAYCNLVDDSFFPKHIPQIDKALNKKKISDAETLLLKMNSKVKQTKLFIERWNKVEDYHRQQNQQRKQEYFKQQQQHQQQQQQQRQQRQQFRPRTANKPTNDYYKVLDIPRDADDKTIKKGYRTQTLKYHPDKYKGNDLTPEQIEKKMQEINQAYEVLSDKELRERYDRGDDPNDPMNSGQSQPQWQAHNGNRNFNFNFNGGGHDFFQQFFGGGHARGGGGQQFKFTQGNPFGNGHQKVKIKKNRKKKKN
ncbi:DnaJ subfamily B member 2 [Candida viswanathii]|uniref:DnaJ subfamily B member 2 n=1 Tax=Candida viswanathii TaxID=5486 RepID=A0A367XN36_9ASCO|nr:DnaJ subfamily B member 2 [Candida viswanathii]